MEPDFTPHQHQALKSLEAKLKYEFKNPALGIMALTVPSPPSADHLPAQINYESLEYIGDAVLTYCSRIKLLKEGHALDINLTMSLFHPLINNHFLAGATLKLGTHKILLNPDGTPVHARLHHPKRLADIMESILGALAIDNDNDLNAAYEIFERHCYNLLLAPKNWNEMVVVQGWPAKKAMPPTYQGMHVESVLSLAQKHDAYVVLSGIKPFGPLDHPAFGEHPFHINWNGQYVVTMNNYYRHTSSPAHPMKVFDMAAWSLLQYLETEHGIT